MLAITNINSIERSVIFVNALRRGQNMKKMVMCLSNGNRLFVRTLRDLKKISQTDSIISIEVPIEHEKYEKFLEMFYANLSAISEISKASVSGFTIQATFTKNGILLQIPQDYYFGITPAIAALYAKKTFEAYRRFEL